MKYAAYIPDFTTSCSEIEHPQHSCGEDDSSDTSTVLHFEVSGGDSDPLDCSSLQLDESRREDYSSKRLRLLVDVGANGEFGQNRTLSLKVFSCMTYRIL